MAMLYVVIVSLFVLCFDINAYTYRKLHIRGTILGRLNMSQSPNNDVKIAKGKYCVNVTLHVKPGDL